jgi:hypothetical protein
MEQQRTGDVHLTFVDAGSSYQTFQDNTTLLERNDDGHSGAALGSEPKSGPRIQLINSDSKVKNEEGKVSGTGAATVSFVLKTSSICSAYFCTVSCQIKYYCSNKLRLEHQKILDNFISEEHNYFLKVV